MLILPVGHSFADTRHSLPVSQMGEYHAAMQKQFASMLRNPYEFDDMDRKRARRYTVGNNMYRSNTNEGVCFSINYTYYLSMPLHRSQVKFSTDFNR